jgi:hypothetical protein
MPGGEPGGQAGDPPAGGSSRVCAQQTSVWAIMTRVSQASLAPKSKKGRLRRPVAGLQHGGVGLVGDKHLEAVPGRGGIRSRACRSAPRPACRSARRQGSRPGPGAAASEVPRPAPRPARGPGPAPTTAPRPGVDRRPPPRPAPARRSRSSRPRPTAQAAGAGRQDHAHSCHRRPASPIDRAAPARGHERQRAHHGWRGGQARQSGPAGPTARSTGPPRRGCRCPAHRRRLRTGDATWLPAPAG